jgi:hypothetical protein
VTNQRRLPTKPIIYRVDVSYTIGDAEVQVPEQFFVKESVARNYVAKTTSELQNASVRLFRLTLADWIFEDNKRRRALVRVLNDEQWIVRKTRLKL